MSGLGLFKKGKAATRPSFDASGSYQSSMNYDSLLTSTAEGDEDEDVGFENIDDESVEGSVNTLSSTPYVACEPGEELKLPQEYVKKAMKLLKQAVKNDATSELISESIALVTKLAGTTYAVKSELGERGVCEALVLLLERNKEDSDTSCEIMRAMREILLSDDENKVRLAKLGGCQMLVDCMQLHTEDPFVLEISCKLIVEFGNGKFANMMEAEFRRREQVRELKSRAMKRQTLTPNRIAAMAPSAAAAAKIALQELDLIEETEREMKQLGTAAETKQEPKPDNKLDVKSILKTDSKDAREAAKEVAEQGEIWDNRLELYRVGGCEALISLLRNLVKMPHAVDHNVTNLPSIFEDEDVVVAACYAIASLTANSVCARAFGRDPHLPKCLSTLLMHFKYWNLMTASAWAVINLCADSASGNRDKLGAAYCCESICRGLVDLTNKQADFVHVTGFDRLLEYYIWALLNLMINNTQNQHKVRMLEREALFQQLAEATWTKAGVKEKAGRVLKLLATPSAAAAAKK